MADKAPKNLRAENQRLTSENQELRLRLGEAEQALEAIRTGQVESLIVEGPDGPRVFSLEGADHAYRVLVEAMNEGAATLGDDGMVLYCNARFAQMLEVPVERAMGDSVRRFLPEHSRPAFDALVRRANGGESRGEVELRSPGGQIVPAYLSLSMIRDGNLRRYCLIAADLRAQKRSEEILAAERFARSVLEQAADVIVVCDESGTIIRASESAQELCPQNPLGSRFDEAFPLVFSETPDAGTQASVAERATRGEILRAVPASLPVPHGTQADVLVSAKGLHGAEGGALGFLVTLVDVSERVRAEKELARAKDQLELTLDSMTDGYFALDQGWRFLAANRVAGRDFANGARHVVGREIWTIGSLPESCSLRERFNEAKESGQPTHFECEVRPGFWAEMHLYSRPGGVLEVYYRDISGRKKVENALRIGEERLRQALEGAQEGTWEWDLKTNVLSWDPRSKELFGFAPEAGVDFDCFMAAVHPDDRRKVREALEVVIRDRADMRIEFRIVPPEGSIQWLYVRCGAFYDEDGKPSRMSGIVLDVTERKRAEERLRKALAEAEEGRRTLQALMENVPEGITVADAQGEIIRMISRFGQELLGGAHEQLSVEEAASRWAAYYPDGQTPMDPQELPLMRALRRGEVVKDAEIVQVCPLGRRLHLLCDAAPIRDGEGRILGGVSAWRDISERKQMEDALREANVRLAEADRRKDQFLAVLSHELRNPLAPIRNSLFVLDHAAPGGEQARRAREVIDRQTGQLARLVDDLLDVTRITRNKIQLQRQRLDLNELVRKTLDDHRAVFEHQEIALELTSAPVPVYVDADWNRVAQVIGNLLHNAAKFTERGGTTRVSVEVDEAARQVIVRMRDNGIGMAPAILARLFEPFSQADETLDRSKGGLGLGLALVKGLVELHGGEVSAYSEGLGKGSELVVKLPLAETQSAVEPHEPEHGGWRRVLIIEDNVDSADSLGEALGFSNHEVAVAYSGPEGLDKARTFHPDVVLCDIGLPGMDGYAVARAFRADEALKGAHLVALTGYASPEDRRRAEEAGFERHLAKPASLVQLEQVLAEATSTASAP